MGKKGELSEACLLVRLSVAQRDPSVNSDHMTLEHCKYPNYNQEDFMSWATSIGSNTAKTVTYFLTAEREFEQGFKACVSMTKLEDRYGSKKLEEVCGEFLRYPPLPSINTVIKSTSNKKAEGGKDGEGK